MTGEHNVSGRSSAYGDNAPDSAMPPIGIGVNQAPRSETNTLDVPTTFTVSSVYSIVQVYIADLLDVLESKRNSDGDWTIFAFRYINMLLHTEIFFISLYNVIFFLLSFHLTSFITVVVWKLIHYSFCY